VLRGRVSRGLLGPAALLAVLGCSPPPVPAVLTLGKQEIRFVSGDVRFTGKGDAPVALVFQAQEDPSRNDGLVLDLQILEKPGTLPHDFAGRSYQEGKTASGPFGRALLLLHKPVLSAGTRPAYTMHTTPMTQLAVTVQAAATGILKAQGTGKAMVDGVEVPVAFSIEKR
jgi:hypothetical protein